MKEKLIRLSQSDWFAAAALLIVFLLTNGYIYGWDDQHVEIPLLKRLIDPALYPGDYYVESLVKNFPSYFFHILAKFISLEQIPAAYFLLYLISRYFLFFWIYKLWLFISKDRGSALICSLVLILLGRVEEFLYRTFSHQEFALAFILAGMYFFYRERYLIAGAILGIGANFHAIYSLFPMIYICGYLLWRNTKKDWVKLIRTMLIFAACALPVLWRIALKLQNTSVSADDPLLQNWLELYKIACPQNFIFLNIPLERIFDDLKTFLAATSKFFYLGGLYLFNFLFNQQFREDRKAQTIALTTVILLAVSFVFTYIWPSRFMLDLNLVRTTQFLLFILVGYTALALIKKVERENLLTGILIGLMFVLFRFADIIAFLAVIFLCLLFLWLKNKKPAVIVGMAIVAAGIIYALISGRYSFSSKILAPVVLVLLILLCVGMRQNLKILRDLSWNKRLFLLIPLLAVFLSFCFFHVRYLNIVKNGEGLWQLQRNWEDMQRYVRKNTPKNAFLLVPHDMEMGGFRISSERKIIVCYRDCGIIGFDFKAARGWEQRLKDVTAFQVYIQKPVEPAIVNAMIKYKVNYIVFMNYAKPTVPVPAMEEMYSNEVFSLFRVKINPIFP